MKIGELAKRTGLAASAIRFYESRGLLKSAPRKGNGYREYSEESEFFLTLIIRSQQAGFTLDEIEQMIPPDLSKWKHGKLISALRKKISDIEELEKKLKLNKSRLKKVLRAVEQKPTDVDCGDNAKQLMKSIKRGKTRKA